MKKEKSIEKFIELKGDSSTSWQFAICPDYNGWFEKYCVKNKISFTSILEVPVDLYEALSIMERLQSLGTNRLRGREFKELNYHTCFRIYIFKDK